MAATSLSFESLGIDCKPSIVSATNMAATSLSFESLGTDCKPSIHHFHVTLLPPCWRTITKDSSLASIVSSPNMAATSLSFDSLGTDCKPWIPITKLFRCVISRTVYLLGSNNDLFACCLLVCCFVYLRTGEFNIYKHFHFSFRNFFPGLKLIACLTIADVTWNSPTDRRIVTSFIVIIVHGPLCSISIAISITKAMSANFQVASFPCYLSEQTCTRGEKGVFVWVKPLRNHCHALIPAPHNRARRRLGIRQND